MDRAANPDDRVTSIKGMYLPDLLHAALAPEASYAEEPDVFVLHNCDSYTCSSWRRTLADLIRTGKPVVLTVYCEVRL